MCYVQCAVTTRVASLRVCLASLGKAYACMHIYVAGQNESWCADSLAWTFVEATHEIPPYIYICIYICMNTYMYKDRFPSQHAGPIRALTPRYCPGLVPLKFGGHKRFVAFDNA